VLAGSVCRGRQNKPLVRNTKNYQNDFKKKIVVKGCSLEMIKKQLQKDCQKINYSSEMVSLIKHALKLTFRNDFIREPFLKVKKKKKGF
jgi:hypothetical protein